MNTLDQKYWNPQWSQWISRRMALIAWVASLVWCRVKTDTIVYNFSNQYSEVKANFNSFFHSAMRDNSSIWVEENGYKKLTVQNNTTENSYTLRIAWDTMVIFVKNKREEIHFSYIAESSQITWPAWKGVRYFSEHLSELQSLLLAQGVSF